MQISNKVLNKSMAAPLKSAAIAVYYKHREV